MRYVFASFAALFLLAIFLDYATSEEIKNNPLPIAAASSTLSVIPAPKPLELPDLSLPANPEPATTTVTSPAEPTPKPVVATPAKPKPNPTPVAVETPSAPVQEPVTPAPPAPAGDIATAAVTARSALVNILCISPYGSGIPSISGSGMIIAQNGIVLTNAHVAEYFLLSDKGVTCTIRTGSPARSTYSAVPIFISPAWMSANTSAVSEASPMGTGEHDIALLAITRSTSSTPLPASFPYIALEDAAPAVNQPVVISTYAAQFLTSQQISSALNPTVVYGSIKDVFTFVTNSVDIVSLGGSAAAQEGSSGGGVVDASGKETAMIVTSTISGDTSSRNLSAITAEYIRRAYRQEAGQSLDTLLATPVLTSIAAFVPQIPVLESQILLTH